VRVSWFSKTVLPISVVTRPSTTNTTVNPATNKAVSTVTRRSVCVRPSVSSPIVRPEMRLR